MIAALLALLLQFSIPFHTGAPAASASTTTYGETTATPGYADYEGANYLVGIYFLTGSNAETLNNCKMAMAASTNASGSQISCAIYTYTTSSSFGAPVSGCAATNYTASSANIAAQTISMSFSSCSLAANTAYWIIANTNDGNFQWDQNDCGGSCSGAVGTATYTVQVSSSNVTFGSTPSNVAFGSDSWRFDEYVIATP